MRNDGVYGYDYKLPELGAITRKVSLEQTKWLMLRRMSNARLSVFRLLLSSRESVFVRLFATPDLLKSSGHIHRRITSIASCPPPLHC